MKKLTLLLATSSMLLVGAVQAQTRGEASMLDANPFGRVTTERSVPACEATLKWSGVALPDELDVGESTDLTFTLSNVGSIATCNKLQFGLVKATELGFGTWTCLVNKAPNTCKAIINKAAVINAMFTIDSPLKPGDVVTLTSKRALTKALPVKGNFTLGVVNGQDVTNGKLVAQAWIYPKKAEIKLAAKYIDEAHELGTFPTVFRPMFLFKNPNKIFNGENIVFEIESTNGTAVDIYINPHVSVNSLVKKSIIGNKLILEYLPLNFSTDVYFDFYLSSNAVPNLKTSIYSKKSNIKVYSDEIKFTENISGSSFNLKNVEFKSGTPNSSLALNFDFIVKNYGSKTISTGNYAFNLDCVNKSTGKVQDGIVWVSNIVPNNILSTWPQIIGNTVSLTSNVVLTTNIVGSKNTYDYCDLYARQQSISTCGEATATSGCKFRSYEQGVTGVNPDKNGNNNSYDDHDHIKIKF